MAISIENTCLCTKNQFECQLEADLGNLLINIPQRYEDSTAYSSKYCQLTLSFQLDVYKD